MDVSSRDSGAIQKNTVVFEFEVFHSEVLQYTNITRQSINTKFILYTMVHMSGRHVST